MKQFIYFSVQIDGKPKNKYNKTSIRDLMLFVTGIGIRELHTPLRKVLI
jgi:hypothetical protein